MCIKSKREKTSKPKWETSKNANRLNTWQREHMGNQVSSNSTFQKGVKGHRAFIQQVCMCILILDKWSKRLNLKQSSLNETIKICVMLLLWVTWKQYMKNPNQYLILELKLHLIPFLSNIDTFFPKKILQKAEALY